MIRRAGRTGGALSLLGLLALVAAGLAAAGAPPAPVGPAKPGKVRRVGQSSPGQTSAPAGVHAIGYRLTAKLTPSSSSSTASGRWDGVLVHMIGTVKAGAIPSIPGCSVTAPKSGAPGNGVPRPRQSGIPHRIKCSGNAVPPFAVPGGGQQWILGWKLSYTNLSSTVNGADIRLNSPGAAGALAATLCGPCTGKFGRTTLTDDQAAALLKGNGYVVVRTATNQDGEISGQIVKFAPTAAHH
jgi:CHRD domain